MEIIDGVRYYSSDKLSEKYLEVNSCGYTLAEHRDIAISRPDGRMDYQLLYIAGGRVRLYDSGCEHELEAGNVVVYRPGEPQIYRHLSEYHTPVYWIHFSGTAAEAVLKQAGFFDKWCFVGSSDRIVGYITGIMHELHVNQVGSELNCVSNMLAMFAELSKVRCALNGADGEELKSRFKAVTVNMNLHCEDEHPVENLATRCGLSKYHFIRLFKQATGFTPHAYLTNVRMKKAEYLLKNTDMNISEIAMMVGYPNQMYFSRIFSKYSGMPPREFRRLG